MTFRAVKARVHNRGTPPDSFISELVEWGRKAPDEIFAPNAVPVDIYAVIKSSLATPAGYDGAGGPVYSWDSLLQRRAAMLEAMRVHAGFESSWNWNEGVDVTNATSMSNLTGQETGIFQVSFDSLHLDHGHSLADCLAKYKVPSGPLANQAVTPQAFIDAMKKDHFLALEYYARLARLSIRWAGPLLRHGDDSVYPYLSRAALAEFEGLLK